MSVSINRRQGPRAWLCAVLVLCFLLAIPGSSWARGRYHHHHHGHGWHGPGLVFAGLALGITAMALSQPRHVYAGPYYAPPPAGYVYYPPAGVVYSPPPVVYSPPPVVYSPPPVVYNPPPMSHSAPAVNDETATAAPATNQEPAQTAVSYSEASAASVAVAAPALNLRSGPGHQFPVVGVVGVGTQLQVLDNTPYWLNVRAPNGAQGWVDRQFTVPLVQPVPAG